MQHGFARRAIPFTWGQWCMVDCSDDNTLYQKSLANCGAFLMPKKINGIAICKKVKSKSYEKEFYMMLIQNKKYMQADKWILHWERPDCTGVSWDWFVSIQRNVSLFYNREFLYTITG